MVEGRLFTHAIGVKDFAAKDPIIKLMLAIGHASTFSQSDEQYRNYLQRLTNKGFKNSSALPESEIDTLLKSVIQSGYAANGSSRYRLTKRGLQKLFHGLNLSEPQLIKPSPKASNEDPQHTSPSANIIPPLALPLKKEGNGLTLDLETHKANQDTVSRIPYRGLEILAELELADGVISAPNSRRRVLTIIRDRACPGIEIGSYYEALKDLSKKDFVELSSDHKTLTLTDTGNQLVALAKAYPDNLRKERQKFQEGSTLFIIDHLIDKLGVKYHRDTPKADLPDATPWLTESGSKSLIPYLAQELDMEEGAATRRLYAMSRKGLIETRISPAGSSSKYARHSITAIRILKDGLVFNQTFQRKMHKANGLLDEADVEEADELVQGCLNLAEELGETTIIKKLKQQCDERSFFELTEEEFSEEKARLEKLFDSLRQDYIFEKAA